MKLLKKHKHSRNIIFYLVLLAIVTPLASLYTQNIVITSILAGVVAVLKEVGGIAVDAYKKSLVKQDDSNSSQTINDNEEIIKDIDQSNVCRIMLYGMPTSGKTTIIENLFTRGTPSPVESTTVFHWYERKDFLELGGAEYKVAVADYRGEDPDQILDEKSLDANHYAVSFFGPPNGRLVNVIFFIVDLFGDDAPNKHLEPDKYKEFLDSYATDAVKKIERRVNANKRYIPEWYLKSIIRVVHSEENLFAIRLFINKMDILEDMLSRNYIPSHSLETATDFALEQYSAVPMRALIKACKENNIHFSTHTISAIAKGQELEKIYEEILRSFSKRSK